MLSFFFDNRQFCESKILLVEGSVLGMELLVPRAIFYRIVAFKALVLFAKVNLFS